MQAHADAKNDDVTINHLQKKLFTTRLDFSSLSVETIKNYVSEIEALSKATYDKIASLKNFPNKITFATVVQPLIDLELATQKARTLCTFPMYVHTNKEVRDENEKAFKELAKIKTECEQRLDTFLVLQKYESEVYLKEAQRLHLEENRYIKELMRNYKRNGLYISDQKTQEKILAIKNKITELCVTFEKNVHEENKMFVMTTEQLAGLPKDWFTEERRLLSNTWKVTLKYPDVFPILDYAENRETRRKIYIAFNTRCEKENTSILKEIVELRQILAQLLGYSTHADYIAETRMVKKATNVRNFLDDMNEKFTSLLEENIKGLTQFAREKEKNNTFTLELYDVRYYLRLREEAYCNINMEEIKKYFPMNRVVNGTLKIYAELLGLEFVESSESKKDNIWHPDVRAFNVYNYDYASKKRGEMIGCFYLDLYPRDGKYSHAMAYTLLYGCDISHITCEPGERQPTEVAMVCNFEKNGNVPFDDVATFFHEFGHVMHFLCSRTKLATFHASNIEVDFVEAPSQMLENWCVEPVALQILSAHPETGKPLPQEVAVKLKTKDMLHIAYEQKRQLVQSRFDFFLHEMSPEKIRKLDIKDYFIRTRDSVLKLPSLDTFFPAAFVHLVCGYEAGYYSYMYSRIYAADMFATIFKDNPLSPANGKKYRQCILAPGASKDAIELVTDFLGRAPKRDAFFEECGVKEKQNSPEFKEETITTRIRLGA